MPRFRRIVTVACLTTLAACGDSKAPKESDFDAAASATVTPEPRVPHVMAFDVGHGLDENGALVGGPAPRFNPHDSLFVAIRTQFASVGADLVTRIRLGNKVVDSARAKVGAPDSTGVAKLTAHFARPQGWTPGSYELEVLLNGQSQGMKPFQVSAQ